MLILSITNSKYYEMGSYDLFLYLYSFNLQISGRVLDLNLEDENNHEKLLMFYSFSTFYDLKIM